MNESKRKCPACGAAGKPVKEVTLRSLLLPDKRADIAKRDYLFCCSPGCDTVYFSEDGSRTFSKEDLTVRVGIKESSPPRPVCYCFGHTVEEIFEEVKMTGKSTVAADVRRRMAEEGCSCETKNPLGSCCLGTVESYAREALAGHGRIEPEEQTPEGTSGECSLGGG